MPKVSVIMPMLNSIRYLRQCMDSVVNQTLRDIEILPVDAGSTDGTIELLENYVQHDSRIKVIHSPKKSWGAQLNLGIEAAGGDYIAFLESDDYMMPNMLEKLYQTAEINNVDFVKADYFEVKENKKSQFGLAKTLPQNRVFWPLEEQDIFANFFIYNAVWSALYRSSFLKGSDYRVHETPGASYQDMSFSFFVWCTAKSVICVPEAYICYRRDNPDSSVKSRKKVFSIMSEFDYINEWLSRRTDIDIKIKKRLRTIEYSHYWGNLCRVADVYSYAFFKRMQKDFRVIAENGELERRYWKDDEWDRVQLLIQDNDSYFEHYVGAYYREFEYPNCMINCHIYEEAVVDKIKNCEQLLIYGAGKRGKRVASWIKKYRKPDAFVVTEYQPQVSRPEEVPILSIDEAGNRYKNPFVVIGVASYAAQVEIAENLREHGFPDVWVPDIEEFERL